MKTIKIYEFKELSQEAKQRALEDYRTKYADSLYDDAAWSTQNDDYWIELLSDYGLTFGGYNKVYFDTYRGNSGFGCLDIEDYKKLADALKLDKRTRAYKLIANEDIHFDLITGREYSDIRSIEFEEYCMTYEEFEALPDAVKHTLDVVCDQLKNIIQEFEAKILEVARADEEYYFSDEGLTEMFEPGDYEFLESGELI